MTGRQENDLLNVIGWFLKIFHAFDLAEAEGYGLQPICYQLTNKHHLKFTSLINDYLRFLRGELSGAGGVSQQQAWPAEAMLCMSMRPLRRPEEQAEGCLGVDVNMSTTALSCCTSPFI